MRKNSLALLSLCCLWMGGCNALLNAFMEGGKVEDAGFTDYEVLVAYQKSEATPVGTTYKLVRYQGELAVLEDGGGKLVFLQTHWTDEQGDHFGGWVKGSGETANAFEFVVPPDRTQPARRFSYAHDKYTVMEIDGVRRPVASDPDQEPDFLLHPEPGPTG